MEQILKYLNAFAAVAETGSMRSAANQLGIAQPAVSRQIKLLEESLKAPLFDREYSGIRLTAAGTKLRDHLLPWLRDLESLCLRISGEESGGLIRFGTLAEAGQSFFMPKVLRYKETRRDVTLAISYAKEDELIEQFGNGKLDAIVTTTPVKGRAIHSQPLMNERIVAVGRFSFPRKINSAMEFSHSRFVAYRNDDPLLQAYAQKIYPTVKTSDLDIVISVNSHRSMIDALLATDSIAIMPWQSVSDYVQAKTLRIVSDREIKGSLFLSTQEPFRVSFLGRTFVEHLASPTL